MDIFEKFHPSQRFLLGDIVVFRQSSAGGGAGSKVFNAASSATVINAGEPVVIVAGASTVIPNGAVTLITVASPYVPFSVSGTGLVGIAETSTVASTAGTIQVLMVNSDTEFLINATTPSLINTQAKYDALVGARVLINATSPAVTGWTYTMALTDSALNGFVVRPLDIVKFPSKVAFMILNTVGLVG